MNQEETQHSQTYGMQWKQGLEGNLYLQMPIFKKKKKKRRIPKQKSNLLP